MFDILHRVGTSATPDKVFDALTTIDGLRSWWVSGAKGDAKKNGRIDFGFCEMQVLAAEQGKLVQWRCVSGPKEWIDTEVTFRIREDSETFVVFAHSGWREPVEFMHHCSTKWGTFLLSLRDEVERGAGRPIPNDVKIIVAEEMAA
jgi:uncharacterized protein YndB with AHSA1/START domain